MAQNRLLAAYMLGATFLPAALYADGLPTAPVVVGGGVTISNPAAGQLLVQQSGQYGIINWGTFSIDQGNLAQFNNGAGTTLNRVTGGQMSSILGTLSATGSVYLVNPNGIVIGKTGVVNTGGRFVATTLDMTDADLLDGGDMTLAGDSDAYVVNLGAVSSMGGDVALIARHVVNEGTIDAPNGTVGLVAGRQILLRDAAVDDGLFAVLVGGADTSVTDAGAIKAAAAELRANGGNVFALAGNTSGTIQATGVAKVNGRVFLTAGDTGKLKIDKPVKAKNADGSGGLITAHGGTVDLSGTVDVSGTQGGVVRVTGADTTFDGEAFATGGSGGFVEISGGHLSFSGDVNTGGGTLLIDPDNIEITDNNGALLDNSTQMSAFGLEGLLADNNVIIQTTGTTGQAGTIAVTSSVFWDSIFSLTLLAHGDVVFDSSVQNDNAAGGDLNVVAGWDGVTGLTAFDNTVFDAAVLATQTLFGTSNVVNYTLKGTTVAATGSVIVGDADGFSGVAVGSKNGATRVYANDLLVQGSQNPDGFGGFAQLGYDTNGGEDGGTIGGNISVRAVGNVSLIAGGSSYTGAQIGHVGVNLADSSATTADATGSISVEALGDMLLEGGFPGEGSAAYAMVGHGSLENSAQTSGDRSGNITVDVGGTLSLQYGESRSNNPWIGHTSADGVIAADVSITAGTLDQGNISSLDFTDTGILNIFNFAVDTQYGNVSITTTNSNMTLTGSTSGISCECDSITTDGNFMVQTAGDLYLDSAFHYANDGLGGLVLASGGFVQNAAGVDAIGGMTGQWNVYSNRPDEDTGTLGVLNVPTITYGQSFDPANPLSNPGVTLSGLVYQVTPHLVFDPGTQTFGDTFVPTDSRLQVDGVTVDGAAFGLTWGVDAINPLQVSVNADGNVNVGVYAAAIQANIGNSTSAAVGGVILDWGTLTVTPATVTVNLADQTKPYDGVGGYTGNVTYAGFIGTDSAALINAGPGFGYAGGDNGGVNAATYTVSASGTGESSGNYVFVETDTAQLVINPLTLSAALNGPITKTYDGTTAATLAPGDFVLSGFLTGQGATVSQTVGTYASANAFVTNSVTAALAAGNFAATGGTILSNYVLPVTASGAGVINPKALTAGLIGGPIKTYDGTTVATLTAGNYLVSGFVGGDGATVTQTVGSYASANAGLSNLVTAALAAGDFTATGTTVLANYVLPVTATGNGVINKATLSVALIGTPTKTYDGTALAMLTAADFQLFGFVTGEGATVTQTVGSYATANAAAANPVTVALASGDFSATGLTLLANYILPTTANGYGTINKAVLSAAIVNNPTKPFDGTTTAYLTSGNYALSGFVAGQGATVTQTTGSYDSATLGSHVVTAGLDGQDFSADAGTLLANYVLPTVAQGVTVEGQGQIGTSPTVPLVVPTRGLIDDSFPTTPLGFDTSPADVLQTIDTETTKAILDEINAGANFCRQFVQAEYAIDCLSDRLQAVADGLSATGEYSEVKAALEDAARKLHAVAVDNASSVLGQKVARSTSGPTRTSSRPLTAVSEAALASANAQASAIIVSTQLVLLRSASNSERKRVAFEQVGQVLGSTKVLLRSS